MKKLLLFTFVLALSASMVEAQDMKKVKLLFQQAEQHLLYEEYDLALPLYLELVNEGWDNANIQFSIGMCYVTKQGQEYLAVPYLEKASQNITSTYREGNYKEDKAPDEALFYLAKSYRLTSQFDKAIETYKKYKSKLPVSDVYYLDFVDLQVKTCEVAQQMMANPILFDKTEIKLSEDGNNYAPAVSGDEQSIAFTSLQNVRDEVSGENLPFNLIFYTKKEDYTWKKPKDITYDIYSDGYFSTCHLSYFGDLMLLYRDDYGNGNIYYSELEGRKWKEITKMPKQISSRYNETHASISKDGNTMFFVSDRPGGFGGKDIYKVLRDSKGKWGVPENIGDGINTPFEEDSPFLLEDNKTLYFASEAHTSMGGYDIFKSVLGDDGKWSEPQNLGYPINTAGDDLFFLPIGDGSIAYFSRVMDGNPNEQIYRMENIRPAPVQEVVAEEVPVNDYVQPAESTETQTPTVTEVAVVEPVAEVIIATPSEYELVGKLSLQDNKDLDPSFYIHVAKTNGEVVSALSPDANTGEFKTRIKPGTYKVNAYGDGYEPASKTIVIDPKQQSAEVLTFLSMVPKQVSSGEYYSIKSILFDYNSAQLNRDSKVEIEKLAKLMQSNPSLKVEVVGNTDSHGSEDYNQSLSYKRANTVIGYIKGKGIASSRFIAKGAGTSNFVAINQNADGTDNPEGRRLNRRVDIKIINPDDANVVTENIFVPDELKYRQQITYTIMLMLSKKSLDPSYFNQSGESINNVWMYQTADGYLYTVGSYQHKSDALTMMNKVVDAGFPDAKIITNLDYMELVPQGSDVYKAKMSELDPKVYTIQLMALKTKLEPTRLKGLFDVEEIKGDDGYYRYIYGEFIGKTSAKQALNDVLQRGFTDAFVVEIDKFKN